MTWEQQFNIVPEVLVDKTVRGYTEAVVDLGQLGSTCTLNLTNGTVLTGVLTASTLCTFTMPTPVAGKSFVLMLKQYVSTGGQGTAVFTNVHWPYNIPAAVTPTAGRMDLFTFFSDGRNWYGSYSQGYDGGDQDLQLSAPKVVSLPDPGNPAWSLLQPIRRAMKGRSTPRR